MDKITINSSIQGYSDKKLILDAVGSLTFISFYISANDYSIFKSYLTYNQDLFIRIDHSTYRLTQVYHDCVIEKINGADCVHIIIYKKDKYGDENTYLSSLNHFNIFANFTRGKGEENRAKIEAELGKKLANTPIPIRKEWIPYLLDEFQKEYFYVISENGYSNNGRERINYDNLDGFTSVSFDIYNATIRKFISHGLLNKEIFIADGNRAISKDEIDPKLAEVNNLNDYLNMFSEDILDKIENNFTPRYNPTKDTYSPKLNDLMEYNKYMGGIDLFEAQKGVIQATANALNDQKSVFIIGEMGTGKTIMSLNAVYLHNREKPGMTNIIMSPGHLVEKWKREIEERIPLSKTIIVKSLQEFIDIMPEIKNKHRKNHLWIILSKETAKFNYEEKPAVVWNGKQKAYTCPHCGAKVRMNKYISECMYNREFRKQTNENAFCEKCHSSLWEAATKENASNWVKTSAGWVNRKHAEKYKQIYMEKEVLSGQESKDLMAFLEIDSKQPRYVRKYPISKYIMKHCKGYIDYFIADEVHQLKSKDSLQGVAFGHLAKAAKKTICLTGTLLNGYASGLFYILYRTFPHIMKREGFEYGSSGETKFVKTYGVIKKSQYEIQEGSRTRYTTTTKEAPGVSPVVFTKFLLENAVFISQEDMSEALPSYEEIPVGIDMDQELETEYTNMQTQIYEHLRENGVSRSSACGQIVQAINLYPDQPYDQLPIFNNRSGEIIYTPVDLDKSVIRNKEQKLLDIIHEKVAAGEKVLVYYHWTNRLDLEERLPELVKQNGYKAAVLKSSVKSQERESWIKKQVDDGIDVLFCNPSLVETGLDLLDFTTIVFYQTGYNLFTLRQASRRSWRLSQDKPVQVYFLYYKNTVQEIVMSLMATKLQAAMAIEGKFTEEGLNAMSQNDDLLTQVASSVVDGIKETVDVQVFAASKKITSAKEISTVPTSKIHLPRNFKYETYGAKYNSLNKRRKNKMPAPAIVGTVQQALSYLNIV